MSVPRPRPQVPGPPRNPQVPQVPGPNPQVPGFFGKYFPQVPGPPQVPYSGPSNLDSICEISGIKMKYMEILETYNNTNITNDLFNKGKIQLGSIDNLIWSDIFDKLQSLPNTIKTTNQRIESERKTLQNINNELEEIEKRKIKLLHQVQEQENKIKLLQDAEKYWNIFKSDKLEGFIQVAENCKEIEKTLSARLNEQLKKDVKGFTDMNDNSDKVKLSLVFNLVGLSPKVVSSLSEYDAESFIDFWEPSNSNSLQDSKDILYCKEMLTEGIIPYTDHEEECPVCNCQNGDELFELFEEYKIDISHDLLKKHELNGRRLVGLSLNDVKQYFNLPKHQVIPFMKSLKKFKDLHKQYMK